MEKIIQKVANLKKVLDEQKEIIEIKQYNNLLKEHKDLLEKIEKYNLNRKESLKEEICNDPFFKEYKEKETNVNIIILKINKILKEINNKGKCGL